MMEIASHQHGLIARKQLLDEGWTSRKIALATESKKLIRVYPKVYRMPGSPVTEKQEIMGVILSYPVDVFASHMTAAQLHGLSFWDDTHIHITKFGRPFEVSRSNTRVHRSLEFIEQDFTVVDNIPVTTIARTLVDLAEYGSSPQVGICIDDAVQRQLVTLKKIDDCYRRVGRWRGRKRFLPLKEALEERLPYSQTESSLERRVLRVITENDLLIPESQFLVEAGGLYYRLDFAYPDFGIAIEVDGYAFHSSREAFDRDRKRDNDLRNIGWQVLRFTSTSSDQEIIRSISAALSRAQLA